MAVLPIEPNNQAALEQLLLDMVQGLLLAASSLILFGCIKWKGYLRIKSDNRIVFELLIAAGAVISGFAGVDRGESIYGVIRLLTVMLVSLCLQQLEEKERDYCLKSIPYAGVLLIFAGIIIQLFPLNRSLLRTDSGGILEGWFSATGRFAGPCWNFLDRKQDSICFVCRISGILHIQIWKREL